MNKINRANRRSTVLSVVFRAVMIAAVAAVVVPLSFALPGENGELPEHGRVPLFLDELTGGMISSVDLGYNAPMVPTSIAVRPNGNLILGTSVAAVELDPLYREISKPGRELFTEEHIAYAYDVTVTDAGTLFARTATGGHVFVIRPGFTRHQRIQTGIDLPATFVASSDGSLVVVDATSQRAVRIEGRSASPIDIYANQYAYVSVATAGPEGTLWVWDIMTGSIGVYTTGGKRIDTITPQLAHDQRGTARSLKALPNGDFVLLTMQGLYRFDRTGARIWHLDRIPSASSGGFTSIHAIELDPQRGYIYLLSIIGQRVIRLLDPTQSAEIQALDRSVLALNQRIARDPDDAEAHAARAALYTQAGAPALAAEAWRTVLDIDPFSQSAETALAAAEGMILAGQARQGTERAIQLLESLGMESARPVYTVTVQLYEQAIARLTPNPAEREQVQRELDRLQRLFADGGRQPRTVTPPRVVATEVSDIFPALIRHYQTNPLGTVTVRNEHDQAIESLLLTATMRFVDRAGSEQTVLSLQPGESVRIPLNIVLSPEAMLLQEDIPVAMRIELSYVSGGVEASTHVNQVVTMRRNTSLYWDDTGKLASFITPNDELVSVFALELARSDSHQTGTSLSTKATRAAMIADALGVYGITYIEDPASPFTRVFGRTGRIDTVRFPRTTLRLRVGDCDETASLLASLYEAAGIHTAIMSSPGHVFLAFDTEEPLTNRWLYEGPGREVIGHGGTVWLPIETTILEQGFVAAWTEASRLIRTHAQEIEFLPYARERERYPSIPLPAASFDVTPPAPHRTAAAHQRSHDRIIDVLYNDALLTIDRQRSGLTDPRLVARLRNQAGVLHARNGNLDRAESEFRAVVAATPDFAPGHLNLANIFLLRNDHALALASAETASRLRPRSAAAHLIRAQALQGLGDSGRARTAIEDLRNVDPELAARYSYLVRETGDVRASTSAADPVTAWERE